MDNHFFVHLFHILVVGSLFLYVGIKKTEIPDYMYNILIVLGCIIIVYHIYKAYKRILSDKSAWVNYIHIFFVGPLLIIIGLNGINTTRKYFELLLMAGMAAIGYHGYYLLFPDL